MIDGSLWEYLVIHLCNIGISKWVLQLLMFARPESIILTSWLLFFCLMAFAKNVDQFRVVQASNRARELLSDLLWKPFFVGSLSWQFSSYFDIILTKDKSRPGLCLKAAAHLFSEAGLQGSQIEVKASFLQFLWQQRIVVVAWHFLGTNDPQGPLDVPNTLV